MQGFVVLWSTVPTGQGWDGKGRDLGPHQTEFGPMAQISADLTLTLKYL